MITAVHRSFSAFPAATQAWLLDLIMEEYAPVLLPLTATPEGWARAVAAADPVFFVCYDGEPLLHIGEASRERLLEALRQEFGTT